MIWMIENINILMIYFFKWSKYENGNQFFNQYYHLI